MTPRPRAVREPLHAYGEFIPGDFDGPHYVRGHVPFVEAFATVCREDGNDPSEWGYTARHVYGRCGQDASTREECWAYTLYEYDSPGVGRFPITRIDYGNRK